jgi:hypothetical protein
MTKQPNMQPADKGYIITFKDPGTLEPRKISKLEADYAERHFEPPAFSIKLPDQRHG